RSVTAFSGNPGLSEEPADPQRLALWDNRKRFRVDGECMRTLFLNPPSFEGFDGGASSRWPASREIESYWYPVWLCYPAGMLPDSKVVDAPPHKISIEQTVEMARDFELLVLYTSTPGFHVDVRMAEMMKDSNPKLKVAFVGP